MSVLSDLDMCIQEYCENLEKKLRMQFPDTQTTFVYEAGRKYVKIINTHNGNQMSSHSFVVIGDQGKFKHGDILKANSWKAPATNFARGNVLTGNYSTISPYGI